MMSKEWRVGTRRHKHEVQAAKARLNPGQRERARYDKLRRKGEAQDERHTR
jgi:hypothetical protein